MPAQAMADARTPPPVAAKDGGRRADWTLFAVACVTLVVGRTIVLRGGKPRDSRRP